MNQDRIDKLGVSAAVTYFCRLGYINPHITFDDKVAVWDGYLEVHKSKDSLSSEDIDFTIDVQVKSSERDSNNFPPNEKQKIRVSDLNHYKEKGGTLLIKVLVGRSKCQLYFAYLGKLELNKILGNCEKDQEEKTVNLIKAPKDHLVVRRELKSIHLQGKYNLLSTTQLESSSDFELHVQAGPMLKKENPLLWMAANPVDILVSLPGFDEPFYIKEGPSFIKTSTKIELPVEINGVQYFESFEISTQRYGIDIKIGSFFSYSDCIPKDSKRVANLSMTPSSTDLNTYIKELEFVLAFATHKSFSLGGKNFSCPDITVNSESVKIFEQRLEYCKLTISLFQMLRIEPTIDITNMPDDERESLDILINCLLNNNTLEKGRINTPVHRFTIGEHVIAVGVDDCGDYLRLYDINKCQTTRINNTGIYQQNFPVFLYCLYQDCLADNINFDTFIESYEIAYKSICCQEFLSDVTLDVLLLIRLYDNMVKNKELYLSKAFELSNWLISKVEEDSHEYNIYLLNSLQCKYRMNEHYTNREFDKLKKLSQSTDLYLPANILLENRDGALYAWSTLDDESKEAIKSFPIYTLYKRLTT